MKEALVMTDGESVDADIGGRQWRRPFSGSYAQPSGNIKVSVPINKYLFYNLKFIKIYHL